MIVMLVRGKPIENGPIGEGVRDSSTTSCSIIEAQKDVERKSGRKGLIYV